ncbi:DUF4342 domain-containing protein [Rubellimicrobium arenae]|uniref:DUF4342 domain-containing protein n=1 Tax=Rubellimicrobium arenae TaxID=2817372 RepID=UPI001B30CAA8|nr:DUF4342 domain-containing protein [Rubellimicrobium arenae]
MSSDMEDQMTDTKDRTVLEEIEVSGNQLVERVKDLFHEGNIRQLRIIARDGETQFEVPLTIGVLAGGVVALAAP